VIGYDRFGPEYRFHIIQVFSFSGGQTQSETNVNRFTLFPIYFQQRSATPELNYTALLPIYGTLKNRLFRDEMHFVMLPLYVQSRKKDIVTDNENSEGLPLLSRECRIAPARRDASHDCDINQSHNAQQKYLPSTRKGYFPFRL